MKAGKTTHGHYLAVYFPDHPKAWKNGYVYAHRAMAEEKLGRFLEEDEVVHHIDGDKTNNNPKNLEVLKREAHTKHHAESVEAKTYHYTCAHCGKPVVKSARQRPEVKRQKNAFCNRSCAGKHNREQQILNGRVNLRT